jgi:hypothetical protein
MNAEGEFFQLTCCCFVGLNDLSGFYFFVVFIFFLYRTKAWEDENKIHKKIYRKVPAQKSF